MVQYNPLQFLPTAEELPETDHKPVDSQLQVLIASLLDDKKKSEVRSQKSEVK